MKIALLSTWIGLALWSGVVRASEPEITLSMSYDFSSRPLTTEGIWQIDPTEPNPHHRRWLLKRDLEILGMKAVKRGDTYALVADKVQAHTLGYVRTESSYFSVIEEFPCSSEEKSEVFATVEGNRYALQEAAKNWQELVSHELVKLEVKLHNVRGEFPEVALLTGRLVFADWLRDLDKEWHEQGERRTRAAEWAFYKNQFSGTCAKWSPTGPSWKDMMGVVKGPENIGKVLAIAPSRRWSGLFSVRVTMQIANREVEGKFLIDSGAPTSVISPVFLQAQGVAPSWIEVPKSIPERIFWSGGSGVGKPADVATVKISGFSIPLHHFVIHDTDFFGPPDSFAACCDGILGVDFLRLYTIVLDSKIPNEVRVYPRENFQYAEGTPWVEASINPRGELVSSCALIPDTRGAEVPEALKWDTGNENAIEIPPSKYASMQKTSRHWDLSCENLPIANSVQISEADGQASSANLDETLDTETHAPAAKSISAGMELLGRGPVTMDLGHGKIWFTKNGLEAPLVQNRSGLLLEYQYKDGERVLKVTAIRKDSNAAKLAKEGLTVGSLITSVDAKGAEEMDQWEVDQRLSGVYGDKVDLEWHVSKKTQKVVSLKVR